LLFQDSKTVFMYPIRGSLEANIKDKHMKWARDGRLEGLLDLIVETLEAGFSKLAIDYSEQLVRRVNERKEGGPALPTRVLDFVKNYKEVRGKLTEAQPVNPEADTWKERLGAAGVTDSPHYSIIHFGAQSVSDAAINRRLETLEKNYLSFYLWHLLSGTVPKMPTTKLLAVLASRSTDMPRLLVHLDGQNIVSDGFYSSSHNLVVLSPERLDENGRTFLQVAKAQYQEGWSRDELLTGKAPPLNGARTFSDIAKAMTFALVDKALEEESDNAAVSREATRQLYASSGLLARHVILPEWVEAGVSNLLHKPKTPGIVNLANAKRGMTVGLFGSGAANFVLLREFREMWTKKELNQVPEDLLMNTLMNRYFEAARTGVDPDPQAGAPDPMGGGIAPPIAPPVPPGGGGVAPPPPGGGIRPGGMSRLPLGDDELALQRPQPGGGGGPMGGGGIGGGGPIGGGGQLEPQQPEPDPNQIKAKLENKAQVTSWALTYYLAKTRMPSLHKFFGEMNKLPRDIRIDKKTSMEIFCRTFNLMTADQSQVDPDAFREFAKNWITYMKAVPQSWYEVAVEAAADPGNPGAGGMVPGGGPGGPGIPGGPGGGR
jgi:hypothetical protein